MLIGANKCPRQTLYRDWASHRTDHVSHPPWQALDPSPELSQLLSKFDEDEMRFEGLRVEVPPFFEGGVFANFCLGGPSGPPQFPARVLRAKPCSVETLGALF